MQLKINRDGFCSISHKHPISRNSLDTDFNSKHYSILSPSRSYTRYDSRTSSAHHKQMLDKTRKSPFKTHTTERVQRRDAHQSSSDSDDMRDSAKFYTTQYLKRQLSKTELEESLARQIEQVLARSGRSPRLLPKTPIKPLTTDNLTRSATSCSPRKSSITRRWVENVNKHLAVSDDSSSDNQFSGDSYEAKQTGVSSDGSM